ncbi:MAG TPA: TonB family protein [Nevskiaceae bacterium]|nr:TonB family protein [Nevskiaceae bacterium]
MRIAVTLIATLFALPALPAPSAEWHPITLPQPPQQVEPVVRKAPRYPAEAARDHVEGCVVVAFEIGTDGLPDKFQVLDSSPKGAFEAAALAALAQWRFKPLDHPQKGIQPISFLLDRRATGTQIGSVPPNCVNPDVGLDGLWATDAPPVIKVVHSEAPYYPPSAVAERAEGCAVVSFGVRPDGKADDYEVVQAKPEMHAFVDAIVYALNHWRFDPSASRGRYQVRYAFRFAPSKRDDCSVPMAVAASGSP